MTVKKIELKIEYVEYNSSESLTKNDSNLLAMAREAINSAYAPYSCYKVGAAVELGNGKIVTGSNQENVAFPSGLCAERVALYSAVSQYPDTNIITIAITSASKDFTVDSPVTPCGSCRQVIAEYEGKQQDKIRFILSGETGKVYIIQGAESLLPLAFKADKLKV